MADEHDDEEITGKAYYKLAPGRSIFNDPSQEKGKVLTGQVVELEPTERVLLAFRSGHIVHATETAFKKYQESVKKEEDERKAKAAPTVVVAPAAAAPATAAAAKTQAAKIIEEAQAEATRIKEQALTEAEEIKSKANKEGGNA